MAFCNNCGKWVKDGGRFCLHCGMDQLPEQGGWEQPGLGLQSARPEVLLPEFDADQEEPVPAVFAADVPLQEVAPPPGESQPDVFARLRRIVKKPAALPVQQETVQETDAAQPQPARVIPTPGIEAFLVPLLLMLIPLAGLVIAFIWAFTDEGNLHRRDLARAVLICYLVMALLLAVLLLVVGPGIRMRLLSTSQYSPPSSGAEGEGGIDDFFREFQNAPRGSSRA